MVGTLQRLLPPALFPGSLAGLGDPPSLLWEGGQFTEGAAGPATGGWGGTCWAPGQERAAGWQLLRLPLTHVDSVLRFYFSALILKRLATCLQRGGPSVWWLPVVTWVWPCWPAAPFWVVVPLHSQDRP